MRTKEGNKDQANSSYRRKSAKYQQASKRPSGCHRTITIKIASDTVKHGLVRIIFLVPIADPEWIWDVQMYKVVMRCQGVEPLFLHSSFATFLLFFSILSSQNRTAPETCREGLNLAP